MSNFGPSSFDAQYAEITRRILLGGTLRMNRTGVATRALPAASISVDLAEGFPLLTLKRTPLRMIAVELEGFIKGITDKRWYQERGCPIWDEWCNPSKVPYGTDPATQDRMRAESDLGPIYGAQWRRFNGASAVEGGDQLENILETLTKAPDSRRMVCSAWNPLQAADQALPPCHVLWQVLVIDGRLHLNWYQRSADWFLGVPFNVASYALLATLLCHYLEFEPGTLTGFFGDTHLYENQFAAAEEMITREPKPPVNLWIPDWVPRGAENFLEWDSRLEIACDDYQSHPPLKVEVVV